MRHLVRRCAQLVLLSLLVQAVPTAAVAAPGLLPQALQVSAKQQDNLGEEPVPVSQPPAWVDPQLPSLVVTIEMAETITVGDTLPFTITVTNQAPYPATDLTLQLPLPAEARAVPPAASPTAGLPPTIGNGGPTRGWNWTVSSLEANTSLQFTGSVHLIHLPASGALLLEPQASARGLDLPVFGSGGALAFDRQAGAGNARFEPGAPARLTSADGRVNVDFSPRAVKRGLALKHQQLADAAPDLVGRGLIVPPERATLRRGLGAFVLEATDDSGTMVHQFDAPVTISVAFTPEQLRVLGSSATDLSLYWFDETQSTERADGTTVRGAWVPIPTQVDSEAGIARAVVDHFSAYQLADGSSPSAAYLPSLQNWQVSTYTGAATYSIPIEVPAGPAGIKPSLELSYSSAATDGVSGLRVNQQAGWVGKGWSLDVGSIGLNRVVTNASTGAHYNYYTMNVNGRSYELVGTGGSDADIPSQWIWRTVDEAFVRVQAVANGTSWDGAPGRGGVVNGVWQPRYTWKLWTTDGTRYEFSEDVWWAWYDCSQYRTEFQANRWLLSKVVDPHGNTIDYTYSRQSAAGSQLTCPTGEWLRGTVDQDIWLSQITWGTNPGQGQTTPRYRVTFETTARTNDTVFDTSVSGMYFGSFSMPRETQRLNAIKVWSNPSGSWQLVRQYELGYDYTLYSDDRVCSGTCGPNTSYPKLTLKSVLRRGSDGSTALPLISFSYQTSGGTDYYATGGWNRLSQVNNGQGGTISFAYAHIGKTYTPPNGWFLNRHRATTATLTDGRGNSYAWQYAYGTPNVNGLGSVLDSRSDTSLGWGGMSTKPTSAVVFYLTYLDNTQRLSNQLKLVSPPMKEFRGHDKVTVTDPSGGVTEHYFHQGEAPCNYPTYPWGDPLSGSQILTNACFAELRNYEMLKGKEYKTVVYASAGGALLKQTETVYGVDFYDDWGPEVLSGLWRSFRYPQKEIVSQYDGSNTPAVVTTFSCYESSYQSGAQRGNRTHTLTYLGSPSISYDVGDTCNRPLTLSNTLPYRVTRQDYTLIDTSTAYRTDRVAQDVTFDGSSVDANGYLNSILALTEHFYDGSLTYKGIGSIGDLTLVRAYGSLTGATLYSQDTRYEYTGYGNLWKTHTYSNWGTRTYPSYSSPGNGSAARTTTTVYDSTFNTFSIKQTNALGHIERAEYDYRMGTLTKVGGPNVADDNTFNTFTCATANVQMEITCATYDVFGRMVILVRPGDTLTSPTKSMVHVDTELPFRYFVREREVAGSASLSNIRYTQRFYDGLGREIQTKVESQDVAQNIIVDRRYDGLNRLIQESQPRYVSEVTPAYSQYTNPGASLYRPTVTTYDALGRVLTVTAPDLSVSSNVFKFVGGQWLVTHYDAKNHAREDVLDVLGRLYQVREYSGNNGSEGSHSPYATTTYYYDRLDQLVNVVDHLGNTTTLYYNALGRKATMVDPDMGTWNYWYDVNGNLVTQQDARGVNVNFGYDALNRMTNQWYSNGEPGRIYAYDEPGALNGKGRRTATCAGTSCSIYQRWDYDGRGRTTYALQAVSGGATLSLSTSYDSADRIATQTYGSGGEVVTYSYDAAWRPTSLCTSLVGCYVSGATYSALDQPEAALYGNNATQGWIYNNSMARLSNLLIGTSSNTTAYFNASYTYDAVGNLQTLTNPGWGTQTYTYDHRDRLTSAQGSLAYEDYTYNQIGNLTSNYGVVYNYGSSGLSTGTGPHQARVVGGQAYSYDANGNLASGGGRTYVWNAENKPTSITSGGVTETYQYDADGNRVARTRSGVTTIYALGAWERVGTNAKKLYNFNGRVVAQRDGVTNAVIWLHPDHLGGSLVTTNGTAGISEAVWYTPWGKVGGGGFTQTSVNFTGQRLDGTGLLYYNARYYDPALGRFVSADSVVPGNASGSMDGVALKPLTVSFSEPGFVGKLNQENQFGPWFTLSDRERQIVGSPMGPQNPQALNRYSYVLNNPLKWTDPSGHHTGRQAWNEWYETEKQRLNDSESRLVVAVSAFKNWARASLDEAEEIDLAKAKDWVNSRSDLTLAEKEILYGALEIGINQAKGLGEFGTFFIWGITVATIHSFYSSQRDLLRNGWENGVIANNIAGLSGYAIAPPGWTCYSGGFCNKGGPGGFVSSPYPKHEHK